ncbi:MAG: DUF1015 domain-containing protein [Candidatus Omnitrophica bacterium]|nr:DUF1015 domain-containing protein [Candidatus Omnitrophota bacterium]
MSLQTILTATKTMVNFQSFQAWRYNPEKVRLGEVLAPPYDIISPKGQDDLYNRSPYNCIRLILNREESGDNEQHNRYTRARDFFNEWRRQNILIQDTKSCFYLYRQVFKDLGGGQIKNRLALLGILRLEPLDKGIVVPHERTLSRPIQDRSQLLETAQTNFSPVFGLYEDPRGAVTSELSRIAKTDPIFDVPDEMDVRHALWAIQDSKVIESLHQGLSASKIYIADGHHRYQTALNYAQAQRCRLGISADSLLPSDFVLTALVEFHDPGLVVHPTHRIVRPFPGFDPGRALESLRPFFKIEPLAPERLAGHLKESVTGQMEFGLILSEGEFLLTLKNLEVLKRKMPGGKPDIWYQVEVNVLGHFILASLWNLPDHQWESTLQFTQNYKEILSSVRDNKAVAGFMLRSPRIEILRDMGDAGELMPQKSTYFYPKLATGMVFYHHR